MKHSEKLDAILSSFLDRVLESVQGPGTDGNTLRTALATLEKFNWLTVEQDKGTDGLEAIRAAQAARKAAQAAKAGQPPTPPSLND